MRRLVWIAGSVASALLACGAELPAPRPQSAPVLGAQLGPSYILLPLGGRDTDLLGRIVAAPPGPGQTLEEVARPNPCAEHLSEPVEARMTNRFQGADELGVSAEASAVLGIHGMSASASRSTHLVYDLSTSKRIAKSETATYAECCATHECGYGFVSVLVHGQGEYAAGEESYAAGKYDVVFAGAEGDVRLVLVERRKVEGYLAAIVTRTQIDGASSAVVAPDRPRASELALAEFDRERVWVEATDVGHGFVFRDRSGPISEREFLDRYQAATGDDRFAGVRAQGGRPGELPAVIGGLIGSAAILGGGVAIMASRASADGDDGKKGLDIGAVIMALYGGMGTAFWGGGLVAVVASSSSPTSHALGELDGRLLARRYNRVIRQRAEHRVASAGTR